MFSLIRAWINGYVNNRGAGDLRLHRIHYDAIVMNGPFTVSQQHLWLHHNGYTILPQVYIGVIKPLYGWLGLLIIANSLT